MFEPMDNPTDFLEKLLDAPGPSGFERRAAEVWRKEAETFADSVGTDVAGRRRVSAGVREALNADQELRPRQRDADGVAWLLDADADRRAFLQAELEHLDNFVLTKARETFFFLFAKMIFVIFVSRRGMEVVAVF